MYGKKGYNDFNTFYLQVHIPSCFSESCASSVGLPSSLCTLNHLLYQKGVIRGLPVQQLRVSCSSRHAFDVLNSRVPQLSAWWLAQHVQVAKCLLEGICALTVSPNQMHVLPWAGGQRDEGRKQRVACDQPARGGGRAKRGR